MGYSQGGDYLTVTFSIRFVPVISFSSLSYLKSRLNRLKVQLY